MMTQPMLYSKCNLINRIEAAAVLKKYGHLMKWKDGCSILDVGCGPGDVTYDILLPAVPKFNKLLGIDISEAMVNHATNHYKHEKVNFKMMDITAEFSSFEQFDHIFSNTVLHRIDDKKMALQNMYKLLKADGSILITIMLDSLCYNIYRDMQIDSKWSKFMKNTQQCSILNANLKDPEREYISNMQDIGFHIDMVKITERILEYSIVNFKNSVSAIDFFKSAIPKNMYDEYLDDFLNRVLGADLNLLQTSSKNQKILCAYTTLLIIGKKFN